MATSKDLIKLILVNFDFDWLHNNGLIGILNNNFWCSWLNKHYELNLVYDSTINYTTLVSKSNTILATASKYNKILTLEAFHYIVKNVDISKYLSKLFQCYYHIVTISSILQRQTADFEHQHTTDDIINSYHKLFNLQSGTNMTDYIDVRLLTDIGKANYDKILQVIGTKMDYIALPSKSKATAKIKTINHNANHSTLVSMIIHEDSFRGCIISLVMDLQHNARMNFCKK